MTAQPKFTASDLQKIAWAVGQELYDNILKEAQRVAQEGYFAAEVSVAVQRGKLEAFDSAVSQLEAGGIRVGIPDNINLRSSSFFGHFDVKRITIRVSWGP